MLTTPSATLSTDHDACASPPTIIILAGWGNTEPFAPTFDAFQREGITCKIVTFPHSAPVSQVLDLTRDKMIRVGKKRTGLVTLGWSDVVFSALNLPLDPTNVLRLAPAPLTAWEHVLARTTLAYEKFRLGSDVPSRALAAYTSQTYGFAPSIGQALDLLKLAKSNLNLNSSAYDLFSNQNANALNLFLRGPRFRIWLDQITESPFPEAAKPA